MSVSLSNLIRAYNIRLEIVKPVFLPFLVALLLNHLIELIVIFSTHFFEHSITIGAFSWVREILFSGLIFWILFLIAPFLKINWIKKLVIGLLTVILLFQILSTYVFVLLLEPISTTLLAFSIQEVAVIADDYLVFKYYYLLFPLGVLAFYLSIKYLKNSTHFLWKIYGFLTLVFLFIPFPNSLSASEKSAVENKSLYFFKTNDLALFPTQYKDLSESIQIYRNSQNRNWSSELYPFLHEDNQSSTLMPFFEFKKSPPNLVFIIVESLSSSYSGNHADFVSFTPFLDSLSKQSLYFTNFLATAQRTFAVLPSTFGSLPHGKRGFTALKNNYPNFYSLPQFLTENGYEATFFYGGHAAFDNMDAFLKSTGVNHIVDRKEYDYSGSIYQTSIDPIPFGIGDRQLFQNSWKTIEKRGNQPTLDIYLTLSTHYPFIYENQQFYKNKATSIIADNKDKMSVKTIEKLEKYKKELASLLYLDDVLKEFFSKYRTKPNFENTIFIIMGDHMMTEIPQKDELEKYRVPFIIHSPLINRNKEICAVNSQLDIAPSLISLFKSKYMWPSPEKVHWLGENFDTLSEYRNNRSLSFMMNNRSMKDFLFKDYFVDGDQVIKLKKSGLFLSNETIDKPEILDMKMASESLHRQVIYMNKLIPSEIARELVFESNEVNSVLMQDEFVSIINTSIPRKFKALEIELSIAFSSSNISEDQLLITSISSEKEDTTLVKYWDKISLKELIHEQENETWLSLNQRIIDGELNIDKGDKLKVYIWNVKQVNNNIEMTNKNCRVYLQKE